MRRPALRFGVGAPCASSTGVGAPCANQAPRQHERPADSPRGHSTGDRTSFGCPQSRRLLVTPQSRGVTVGDVPKRSGAEAQVTELIARRDGVCRRTDLEQLGLPSSTVSFRARPNGPWQRLFPGVVLTNSGVPTHRQFLLAALAYAGGGAVLSGHTALALYGVRSASSAEPLHVLIPHRRRRRSVRGLVIERTKRLPHHRSRDGLPCAPIERAVIDAVRKMTGRNEIRGVIAEVVQRGLATLPQLADELRATQQRGTALPRVVLREVTEGVRSAAEGRARDQISAAKLPKPLWNCDVYDANGEWLARPDAIWPDLGVVLEIDSLEWHLSPGSYRRTQARQRRLARVGLIVLPVTPAAVRDDPRAFIEELKIALEEGQRRRPPAVTVRSPSGTGAARNGL
jgi:hypothetical protein